jgi:hypothetical protein
MTLRRLGLIAVSYVAACCVAASVIALTLLAFSTSQSPFVLDLDLIRITAMFVGFIAWYVALLALIPFVIAVAFAERNDIVALGWYVVAGAVAGVIGLGLNIGLTAPRGGIRLSDLSAHPILATFAGATLLAAIAGMSAAYAYWLMAVRRRRSGSN